MAIPALVWHELRFGCMRLKPSRRRDLIARYLEDVVAVTLTTLDYDQRAAEWHAAERARLAAMGRMPPFVDTQIAAIAKVNDLTLVTANPSDFEDFEGLNIAVW